MIPASQNSRAAEESIAGLKNTIDLLRDSIGEVSSSRAGFEAGR